MMQSVLQLGCAGWSVRGQEKLGGHPAFLPAEVVTKLLLLVRQQLGLSRWAKPPKGCFAPGSCSYGWHAARRGCPFMGWRRQQAQLSQYCFICTGVP